MLYETATMMPLPYGWVGEFRGKKVEILGVAFVKLITSQFAYVANLDSTPYVFGLNGDDFLTNVRYEGWK